MKKSASNVVDDYIAKVRLNDAGSELLASMCAPTLKNSEYIDIVNNLAVFRVPEGYEVVVHSSGGDIREKDLYKYTYSVVDRLVGQAEAANAKPIGFADVIDSVTSDSELLSRIGGALVDAADYYGLAITNGENAFLGNRLNCDANVSATMVSIRKKDEKCCGCSETKVFKTDDAVYAVFDANSMAVFINSDGVGTKTEFYERAKKHHLAVNDSLAMKVDDSIKIGATVKVVSDVVETKGNIPFSKIERYASDLGTKMGFAYIMQHEDVGDRLRGYNDTVPSYNISGSAVSVIDEDRLNNLPHPSAGEWLVAIKGNSRSNGITSKRKVMNIIGSEWCKKHGVKEWHETPEGREYLEYLIRESIVFYPLFRKLIDSNLATSVYHMSGGAYNGKLARPVSKNNLFVSIDNLFMPDWREIKLAEALSLTAEDAYGQWPMGNEGFVTTANPAGAIKAISGFGLEARAVGVLFDAAEKSGVLINAFNGKKVHFSGR